MESRSGKLQSMVLTLSSDLSDLIQVLTKLQQSETRIKHIESRSSHDGIFTNYSEAKDEKRDYYLEFNAPYPEVTGKLVTELKNFSTNKVVLSRLTSSSRPWFPKHVSDLHRCCNTQFKYGDELGEDHPGYGDEEYVQRRKVIAEISKSYHYGDKIPNVEFTEWEIETWGEVFRNLNHLYPTHASHAYNEHFSELFSSCGYREDNIPQLEDVSRYLRGKTGWQLCPAIGWVPPRNFLNALAFRVFPTTQYIRHHSSPFYIPEPDICHELMGHAPLFCDPVFAQFSQEIGLASLGISDEWLEKLASLYWFTVEFGLVDEGGQPKAYGAGILSSCEELQHCITDTPTRQELEIEKATVTSYPETGLQPLYFVAKSMEDMRSKLLEFSQTIPRDFLVRYDSYTQHVNVLDSDEEIRKLSKDLQNQATLLNQSLAKLDN